MPLRVAGKIIRILSDVHFGDRASRVRRLRQLAPLVEDADEIVFNGDTLDTRTGPNPAHTAACLEEVRAFARESWVPVTFLTGNHDPDISAHHSLDLANGEVFAVHGDMLFEDVVPWGRDARELRTKIWHALAARRDRDISLADRLAIWREAAGSIPQRHQSEQHPLKYALHFISDTVWPPTRFFEIFRAWHREPHLATELIRRDRPNARFVLLGHTHRPALRRVGDGPLAINTGSFTAPFGGRAVELADARLRVVTIDYRGGEFRRGEVVAEFPLASG